MQNSVLPPHHSSSPPPDSILPVELVNRSSAVGLFAHPCNACWHVYCLFPAPCPTSDRSVIHDDCRSWLLHVTYGSSRLLVAVAEHTMTDEMGPRLTHVCHCVLLWVFDVGQGGKDEQG